MAPRVRFAPSPTGKVHIGNIRTAIFNWLFARHEHGEFLLRIEDTDLERSTREAIDALLDSMAWLGLDHDGEIIYQTSRSVQHVQSGMEMLANGSAYYGTPDQSGKAPLIFRIPMDCEHIPAVRAAGDAELELHPETPLLVSAAGVEFAQPSRKGKPMPCGGCLAGFINLNAFAADGSILFSLDKELDNVRNGQSFSITGCARITFTRREVFFNDLIKGELAKPLDGIKDLVIVRSDGSPVFHLANVCDDIFQNITHIVRGDDHVENTYRHILLFHALKTTPPHYAHMPMIVNREGKPYSKRDGDAFVGDFRDKGYLPDAFFNYLSLLGWSPGDDREKMSRGEMIEAFDLNRVKSSPAQFDFAKLENMNGAYIAEMPLDDFTAWAKIYAENAGIDSTHPLFAKVARLMQTRTKNAAGVAEWKYFFSNDLSYNHKAVCKQLADAVIRQGLEAFRSAIPPELTPELAERLIRDTESSLQLGEGKLNQPLRLAASGNTSGADLYATLALLGSGIMRERVSALLEYHEKNRNATGC